MKDEKDKLPRRNWRLKFEIYLGFIHFGFGVAASLLEQLCK